MLTPLKRVMRRFRGYFLATAVAITVLLFAGLVHDFGTASPEAAWLTPRPAVAGVLLAVGFAAMLAHQFSGDGSD